MACRVQSFDRLAHQLYAVQRRPRRTFDQVQLRWILTQRSQQETQRNNFEEQEFIIEMLPAVGFVVFRYPSLPAVRLFMAGSLTFSEKTCHALGNAVWHSSAFVHGREPYLFRKDLPCSWKCGLALFEMRFGTFRSEVTTVRPSHSEVDLSYGLLTVRPPRRL